jgi:hypothetical protein
VMDAFASLLGMCGQATGKFNDDSGRATLGVMELALED